MDQEQRLADLEMLARIAARRAGRDPDERVSMILVGVTVFEGPVWQYPDFMGRAEEALAILSNAIGPSF